MVHITLNGYTGAAERRPRRDARPLHTGTTLFRSVPLSRFTLSPLSCRRRRTDSLSFYLFLPLYSLLRSLLSTAGTSLFCSFDRLLFSVSVIDDSPFDPLCDSGTSRSLPPSLTLSLLFASLSSIVGLEAPRICPCCSPSDCRRFSVFFSHQVAALSVSFSPPIPSLPRVERERETALSLFLFCISLFIPLPSFLSFSLLAVLFYPVLSSRLPSSFSLSFSLTSSTSVFVVSSPSSPVRVFSVSSFLVSRHPAFLSFALRPP